MENALVSENQMLIANQVEGDGSGGNENGEHVIASESRNCFNKIFDFHFVHKKKYFLIMTLYENKLIYCLFYIFSPSTSSENSRIF